MVLRCCEEAERPARRGNGETVTRTVAPPREAEEKMFGSIGGPELLVIFVIALLSSVFAIAGAFALCLAYSRDILDYFIRPIRPFLGENKPVYLDLAEPFMLYMKVAFLASLFLAAPVILYQVWAFIRPGLYPKERRYAVPFVLFATVFFVLGGAFGYGVAFPVACKFLLSVAEG